MKIAIAGTAPSSAHLVPFDDKTWKIWGIGVHASQYKRIDKVFEIHDSLEGAESVPADYYDRLIKLGITIVVSDKCPFNPPKKEVFPYARAADMLGELNLTSTIAYMMALAILEGATEIGIFGADMSVDNEEYFYQRPCVEQWIGYAKAKGIKITIPKESPLGKSPYVYGKQKTSRFDTGIFSEAEFMALAAQHRERVDQLNAKRENLLLQMNAQSGAAEAYERMAKVARAIADGQAIKSLTHTALIK